jgi:hypothetical protein
VVLGNVVGSCTRRPNRWNLQTDFGIASSCYTVVIRSRKRSVKTQPFSIRLGEAADLLVREEGRRSGRSRGAVVEELAEEAAKTRLFPGIAFRGSPRRAWVIGSGLDIWEIVELLHVYDNEEQVLRQSHPLVAERHLRLARAYAERFPEEIEPFLADTRRPLAELRSLYPFLESPD